MDRPTVYYGQLPRETDLLTLGQSAMVALAKLGESVLGTASAVDGFTLAPTSPASLNVTLGPGVIYQLENLEQSVWSSLPADLSHSVLKQGILLDPVTLGVTPPGTVGYSQVFLVQVEYQDLDTGSVVLPYFNPADPTHNLNGPGNNGQAQNTIRKGAVAYQLKAGIAAVTGTQAAPAPDAGFVGLYTITVANGATAISAGNIALYSAAPFIPVKLPAVPAGVQAGKWVFANDASATANAMKVTLSPVPAQLTPGMTVRVKKNSLANTGATTLDVGLGANAVQRVNGSATTGGDIPANSVCEFTWDGAVWQMVNFQGITATTTNNNNFTLTIPYAQDSGTANNVVANFTPAVTAVAAGDLFKVKLANDLTGASQITINGLAAISLVRRDGAPTHFRDAVAGEIVLLESDGTNLQIVNAAMTRHNLVPMFPEVMTSNFQMTVTPTAGQVALSAGQAFMWRGTTYISTSNFAGGALLFATAASKTFHLRWYAPGVGRAAPATTYPFGRFYLEDLSDAASYNPGSLAETNTTFDTAYDSMLIAKVVTDVSNNPTVTPLANKAFLTAYAELIGDGTAYWISTGVTAGVDYAVTLNWSRTPTTRSLSAYLYNATVGTTNRYVSGGDEISGQTASRYRYAFSILRNWFEGATGITLAGMQSQGYAGFAA